MIVRCGGDEMRCWVGVGGKKNARGRRGVEVGALVLSTLLSPLGPPNLGETRRATAKRHTIDKESHNEICLN